MFIFKRNNGFYYLNTTDPLTNKRKSISTKCRHKAGAERFKRAYEKRDTKPIQPVVYLDTLETEVLRYVKDNLSRSSYDCYRIAFNQLRAIIGNKPLKMYTARDIEQYKAVRIERVKKVSVNVELRVLKALFNIAIKWNWLDTNPLRNVRQFPLPDKKPLAFSSNELERIYAVIELPVLRNMVRFSLLTACRLNEMLNVQLKDIDITNGVLNISNKATFKTKSGKNRSIPISRALSELLTTIIPEGNVLDLNHYDRYLFNKAGFRYSGDYISKAFKTCLRKAGFNEMYHWHCLRHTAISNMVRAGGNIRLIQAIAGHSNLETTERYIHLATNDLRCVVNLLE